MANTPAMVKALAIGAAVSMVFGCRFFEDPDIVETDPGISLQRVQLGQGQAQSSPGGPDSPQHFVSVDVLMNDAQGNAIGCDDADIDIDIDVSYDGPGQGFEPVDDTTVRSLCGQQNEADVAIVVDNSGSLESFVDKASEAARDLAHTVIDDGGRVALIRISSYSETLIGLTDDTDVIDDHLDGLFVNDGWTALYDGIRIGNTTLAQQLASIGDDDYDDVDDFCQSQNPFYVVGITDGQDNNSSEQQMATPEGDGIDTEFEDLFDLNVGGVTTPVYTVGVGVDVEHDKLQQLADETGGKHFQASTDASIQDALNAIANYPAATHRVCAETSNPPQQDQSGQQGCGVSWTQVNYGDGAQSDQFSGSDTQQTQAPCPHSPPSGRSVGLLFKLSHPSIDDDVASRLAENAARWAADNADPEVLVVRDNNHNDHFADDPIHIQGLLDDANIDATFMEEPASGLSPGTLNNYDVVWFSNPDQPMDDKSSLLSMLKFIGDGGGVILSGDDMTASKYQSFSMDNLLHVDHQSNGTYTCGDYIYGDEGQEFTVDIPDSDHPVLDGVSAQSFNYGYNIDHSTALDRGEDILAEAHFEDGDGCEVATPAIVAFSDD